MHMVMNMLCVMGNGKAAILEHTEEKRLALSKLMWHQTGKEFEISELDGR